MFSLGLPNVLRNSLAAPTVVDHLQPTGFERSAEATKVADMRVVSTKLRGGRRAGIVSGWKSQRATSRMADDSDSFPII
jgi:hypothetical protein